MASRQWRIVPRDGLSSRRAQSKKDCAARILIPPDPPSVAGASLQREGYPVQGGGGVKFRIFRGLRCKVRENKGVVGVKQSGHPRRGLEKKPRDDSARGSKKWHAD